MTPRRLAIRPGAGHYPWPDEPESFATTVAGFLAHTGLPRLAPHLPLAVPVPVGVGRPDFGYPWPWAVSRWLDGEVATAAALADSSETAVELARFLTALQQFAPADTEVGAARGALTGRPLADRETLMSARSRAAFRTALGVDDARWTGGRGWALATGLNAYTSYAAVNPRVAAQSTRQITEALIG